MTTPALPTFVAIVLHYRDPEAVAACLASLREQSARPVRTVVVDNGSDDDRLRDVVAAFPGTEVVTATENLGYGAGMSLGLDRVGLGRGDAALFVTQDSVRRVVRGGMSQLHDDVDIAPAVVAYNGGAL